MSGMDSQRKILVIGGAGLVGTPIVRRLDEDGWSVRVTSRSAGKAREKLGLRVELVPGDADRPEDLERALAGCRAVLICVNDILDPYLDLRVTRNVVKLARGQDVERIGLISGATVAEERRFFPMIDAKFQAEEELKASGIPWVIFRLTWPMESLARFVQGSRASVLGRQPATIHPVAGADIGRMVSRAFELNEAAGHTFTIHGPDAFTMKTWLERYCALTRPKTRVGNVPFWVLSIVAALTFNRTLKAVVALMKYLEGQGEHGDPGEANRILGAPSITLEQWVASLGEAKETPQRSSQKG